MSTPIETLSKRISESLDSVEPTPLRDTDIEHTVLKAQDLGLKLPKVTRETAQRSAGYRTLIPHRASVWRQEVDKLKREATTVQNAADVEAIMNGANLLDIVQEPGAVEWLQDQERRVARAIKVSKLAGEALRRDLEAELSSKASLDAMDKGWSNTVKYEPDFEASLAEHNAALAAADEMASLLFRLYSTAVTLRSQRPEVQKAVEHAFKKVRPEKMPTVALIERQLREAEFNSPQKKAERRRAEAKKAEALKAKESARIAAIARQGGTSRTPNNTKEARRLTNKETANGNPEAEDIQHQP